MNNGKKPFMTVYEDEILCKTLTSEVTWIRKVRFPHSERHYYLECVDLTGRKFKNIYYSTIFEPDKFGFLDDTFGACVKYDEEGLDIYVVR